MWAAHHLRLLHINLQLPEGARPSAARALKRRLAYGRLIASAGAACEALCASRKTL